MGFSTNGRATFLALMSHLGRDGDRDAVVTFLRDHWAEALEEVVAQPGWDQVRAGLLRALPSLVDEEARQRLLEGAAAALDAFPADAASGDPALRLARHPAWVGLAALELAMAERGTLEGADLSRAVALAAPGFRAAGVQHEIGRGEILWAMGEQAEEVGWIERARQLLRLASEAPFARPEHAASVRLLLGLSLVEDEEPEGALVLQALGEDEQAADQARIHAWWVLHAVARREGRIDDAEQALERALERALLSEDEDSEVIQRVQAAKAELRG